MELVDIIMDKAQVQVEAAAVELVENQELQWQVEPILVVVEVVEVIQE